MGSKNTLFWFNWEILDCGLSFRIDSERRISDDAEDDRFLPLDQATDV
jgi:hypothetical protein